MTLKTTAERLQEVDDAISLVLQGQRVIFEGDSFQLAELSELRAYRAELYRQYQAENGTGSGVNYVQFDGP